MQRRERDLARAGEVEIVLGEVVDLLLGVGQKARAVERLPADEHRRDDRLEAVAAELRQRPLDERELEHREVAAQVGEARARQPRAALHVDPVTGELEVVAAGLRRVADDAQHLVRGLGGRRVGQVRERLQQRLELGVGLPRLLPAALDVRRQRLQPVERARDVAALALAARDLLRGRLLLGAQRLGGLRRVAPAAVEIDDGVDALGEVAATARERRPNRLGVPADQPEIQHVVGGYPPESDLLTGVLRDELRDLARLFAGDDVLGHDRAGEAAVGDREEDVGDVLLAEVEVRAVDVLAVGDVRRRALRAGHLERVAAAAAGGEDPRALVVRIGR